MLFNIISPYSIGGTFLDWSLHYISGKKKYYNVENMQWENIVLTAFDAKNAHKHKKNHPNGLVNVEKYRKILSTHKQNFHSIYPSYNHQIIVNDTNIIDKLKLELTRIWDNAHYHNDHIILLTPQLKDMLFINLLNRGEDDIRDDTIYNQNKNEKIWDYRERIALSKNFFSNEQLSIIDDIDTRQAHLHLTLNDMLLLDNIICELCYKLKIKIDYDRLQSWYVIFNKWKYNSMMSMYYFCTNLPVIIHSICNGNYYDLSLYRMDIIKEAIILHVLIYKFNLNIKNWNLQSFPTNTQLIYELLEPNIHVISNNTMHIENYSALL